MLTLTLTRKQEYDVVKWKDKPDEPAMIGELVATDESGAVLFKCATCENGGNETDEPNQDKRIVAREYQLEWSDSTTNGATAKAYPKWKHANGRNIVLWLKCRELPRFASRRILIHSGNCPQHTEGCILLGYQDNGNGTISQSTACINDFFNLVEKHGAEHTKLIIQYRNR